MTNVADGIRTVLSTQDQSMSIDFQSKPLYDEPSRSVSSENTYIDIHMMIGKSKATDNNS
jgi:hypothetical protein